MTAHVIMVILVVGVRFLAPLFILRYPLPAVLLCLVADAVDQTVFTAVLHTDLPWYQSYDKALDVYYLSFAFISTLKNWHDETAFQVSRFLFIWRLIGVTLFEITHWRFLLLVFPNAFEYFFIAYEAVRTRWNPQRLRTVAVAMALAITVFIKLPQETWIHLLRLDFTDVVAGQPAIGGIVVAALALLCVMAVRRVRQGPNPDWPFTLNARRHLPARPALGQVTERLVDPILAEKVVVLTLVGVVLAHIVPELSVSNTRLAVTVALLVFLNATVTEWWHNRRGRGWSTTTKEFLVVLAVNLALLAIVPEVLLADGLPESDSLMLVVMLSLLATMYDRGRDTRPPAEPPAHPWRDAWVAWTRRRAAPPRG